MAYVALSFSVGEVLASSKMNQMDTNIDEVRTQHKGSSAPASLAAGVLWIDDTASPWTWQLYDGADWIKIGNIDPTNDVFQLGWEPIETQTASASSSLDFETGIDGTADIYKIVFTDFQPADDHVNLKARTSTDGGIGYDATNGDYSYHTHLMRAGSAAYTASVPGDGDEIIISDAVGFSAGEQVSGVIYLFTPSTTSRTKISGFTTSEDNASLLEGSFFVGHRDSAADVDAIQILFDSGNIASGKATLYKLRR